jgi:RHS repeat-associated protein
MIGRTVVRLLLAAALIVRATSLAAQGAGQTKQRYSLYSPQLNLIAETTTSTTTAPPIAYEYVWFGGEPVAQIETGTADVHWYFNDHLGTPLLTTSISGNIDWRVEREAYGNRYLRSGADRYQPLGLPGQETGVALQTQYNIFRWYRTTWGRYTQADPIGLGGGMNVLGYVNGNPVNIIDRVGLVCGIDVWSEPATISPAAGLSNAYKSTWGHQWLQYPGGSAGFWPQSRPSGPIAPLQSVPGIVQSPDPLTKSKGNYTKAETYFSVFQCHGDCAKAIACVKQAVLQSSTSPPSYCLATNNCQDFVSQILSQCGLTTQTPFEQLESNK